MAGLEGSVAVGAAPALGLGGISALASRDTRPGRPILGAEPRAVHSRARLPPEFSDKGAGMHIEIAYRHFGGEKWRQG